MKPYMRLVHTATTEGKGIADLATLHALVQSHLEAIIADLLILLGSTAMVPNATLDGSEWDNPEVFDTLCTHESELSYIVDLFVPFCRGA